VATDRLFVYGTLAPGRPNEHLLAGLRGTWHPATVRGTLHPSGWGAALGYPGIVLDEAGSQVRGLLFSSEDLAAHWARLDDFEGEGYERVLVEATLEGGTVVQAFVYALSGRAAAPPRDPSGMAESGSVEIPAGEARIFVQRSGSGSPILLLHGFPQTHLMWREVAPRLARSHTVVCADLRGYGRSSCPASTPDHAPYAKRAMAQDMVTAMERLGFPRFSVAGHDRGGRVAYRMALDHPGRVDRLAVLDVLPTATAWDRADARFALAYWPWSLLAQPEPFPERLLAAAPEAIVDNALGGWGTPATAFSADVRAAYVDALRDPAHVHAICEEYRAAATLDRQHDAADRLAGNRIGCPLLVLWSGRGALDGWYAEAGGPLALWREWGDDVHGHPLDAGHFFPEEAPELTAEHLARFFAAR
jgi:haloacetate dehalogenase